MPERRDYKGAFIEVLKVVVYFVSITLYFNERFEKSTLDSIYFGVVTMTTVGYGDISASGGEWYDYVVNMFFIIYGVVFAFLPINKLIGGAVASTEKKILDILDDDPNDDFEPHDAKLMLSLLVLVFTPIAGAVFFAVNEQWSFIDALFWSVITVTTIGYGDLSLNEQSSRTFAIFYITFSVVVLAHCLGTFTVVAEDKKKEKQVLELKAKAQKMDPSFLMEILADSDDTDGKVDKGEFLEFVFCKLQLCSKADTGPILKRFKELDVDGSGALDKEDFDKMVKDELQKQEMRAAKVERARGHSIFAPKGDPKQHALDGTSKWTGGSAKHQPLEESNGKEVEMTATEVTNPASKSRQNADRHEI